MFPNIFPCGIGKVLGKMVDFIRKNTLVNVFHLLLFLPGPHGITGLRLVSVSTPRPSYDDEALVSSLRPDQLQKDYGETPAAPFLNALSATGLVANGHTGTEEYMWKRQLLFRVAQLAASKVPLVLGESWGIIHRARTRFLSFSPANMLVVDFAFR